MEAGGFRGSGSSALVFLFFFSSSMPVRLALVMDNEGVYMTNGNTTQWRYMGIEAVE